MSRVKISEFKAKSILWDKLGLAYDGLSITTHDSAWAQKLSSLSSAQTYVVKVDQGVKKRAKTGLLKLNVPHNEVEDAVRELAKKGFSHFLVETFYPHSGQDERYFAMERVREGIRVWFHTQGGIDIEDSAAQGKMQEYMLDETSVEAVSKATGMPLDILNRLFDTFKNEYWAFLEINPLLLEGDSIKILDLAVEVDSAGEYFVRTWKKDDFVQKKVTLDEEAAVKALSEKSPSSFSLDILNADGAIFMLLSGGGASLVIADEYSNLGFGTSIANYGEYSGAPNEDETYEYARNIIALMLKSKAEKKILLIAGGVANFTDVSITFKGIIRALKEKVLELQAQNIAIFVRRGGPNQEKGLTLMRQFVHESELEGQIEGPDCSLHDIVKLSLKNIAA